MLLSIIKPPCNIADMNSKQNPNEPVTVGTLNEAVDAILEGIEKMVGGVRGEMNERFDKVDNRLQGVETEVRFVKDEINGLKADLSTTPSRGEFEELKTKVNKVLSN
jgi:archaellum component FlaC